MSQIDERIDGMLRSPLGCAFLFMADTLGLTPRQISEPAISLSLGAYAANQVDVWRADYRRVAGEVLRRGTQYASLACQLLLEPATDWWFTPPNRDHQVYVPRDAKAPDSSTMVTPTGPPTHWERYAQKVLGAMHTSTLQAGSLLAGTSSMFEALDQVTCDIGIGYPGPPFASWHMKVDPSARIFEVDGPKAWHNLCSRYPTDARNRITPMVELVTALSNPDFAEDKGRLVPDWSAVAADWDGVHLTFGGLLTSEQVPVESPAGWTYHWGWHAEQTMWLRWMFTEIRRMPDHLPTPLFLAARPLDFLLR